MLNIFLKSLVYTENFLVMKFNAFSSNISDPVNLYSKIYLICVDVYGLKVILQVPILDFILGESLYGKSIVLAIIITENL